MPALSHLRRAPLALVAFVTVALACVTLAPPAAFAQPVEPAAPVTAAPAPPPVVTEPPALPNPTDVPSPSATATPPTGRRLAAFRITAQRIAFYSNRYIVGANGNVALRLGDGTRVTGNTFFMDLRLNRFVIAGNVKVYAGGREIDGAGFSEYFDFDRAYFVPLLNEPDRWTFVAGDYAHPALGRLMPGDTFYLPNLAGERVFLYARAAIIDPRESVRFAPATINFGLAFVPFPSYFLDFSQNPNYAQNALPGAYADGPLDFAGGPHGLATAHLRYDPQNKVFPAYEEHQISDNHYLVAAISPLTRPFKTYNFVGFDRLSPGLQTQLFLQEQAFQHDFNRPLAASALGQLQITGSLRHSFLQLRVDQFYDSLLDQPSTFAGSPTGPKTYYYGDLSHTWAPDHPADVSLSWVGYRVDALRHALPRTLYYQLRSSVGFAHNRDTPLETLGGVNYHSLYDKTLGVTLTTKSIPLVHSPTHRDLYLTLTADKLRRYFSSPHHTDTTTETISLTDLVDPQKIAVLASYSNTNIGDFFGRQQAIAYANPGPAIDPFTGQAYAGYESFRGFATTRSFTQQLVLTPNPILSFTATLRENRDFPAPIPGAPVLVGDAVGFSNVGFTPYQATFDLRYRFNRVLVLDVQRSYFFNFGGYERWQPQFLFQIEK